jgi:drug/metabolite transporter (DMT)-like permease
MLARIARYGHIGWSGRTGLGTGVLLVALGAALWGTDGVLRVPLLRDMSPAAIVLGEHLLLLLYSVPAVVIGWSSLRRLDGRGWTALLVIGWGGSALATLLFTAAFAAGDPTVAILLQKTQPIFAIILAHIVLGERLGLAYWPLFAAAMVGAYLVSFGNLGPFAAFASGAAPGAFLALGAALLWGSSTALGRFVLKDIPFHALTGARLLLAVAPLTVIALAQGSFGELGVGFASQPGRLVLLALIPGLLGLLLYYRGLSGTKASHATLAELAFPATAVALNWALLGVGINAGQVVGFFVLWAAIYGLSRLGEQRGEGATTDHGPQEGR